MQMIPAYSPQARGRSERNFGTWQGTAAAGVAAGRNHHSGRKPTRTSVTTTLAVFNDQFTVEARERGTAFRRTSRSDLEWIFTLQTERVVAKDNTVAIGDQSWQLEKSKFRGSLAGCTVTIHEHLDGRVSIRYGPHVVGRYTATGEILRAGASPAPKSRGKDGPVETVENHKPVSHCPHRPLEIPQPRRDSHFSTAPTIAFPSPTKTRTRIRKPPSASRRGPADLTLKRSVKQSKPDRSCVN